MKFILECAKYLERSRTKGRCAISEGGEKKKKIITSILHNIKKTTAASWGPKALSCQFSFLADPHTPACLFLISSDDSAGLARPVYTGHNGGFRWRLYSAAFAARHPCHVARNRPLKCAEIGSRDTLALSEAILVDSRSSSTRALSVGVAIKRCQRNIDTLQ